MVSDAHQGTIEGGATGLGCPISHCAAGGGGGVRGDPGTPSGSEYTDRGEEGESEC